ncbi:MAG: ATP-binding protein [Candidatus Colwellbacteria bacterium]
MSGLAKPVLHNGYQLKKDLYIKSRVERAFFTEVYLLSDDRYFYLFLDLEPNEVLDKSGKFDLIRIDNGGQELLGVVMEEHDSKKVPAILKELTTLTGFECIAGMEELKALLISDVINPLKFPEKFTKFKVSIPNGIILYGPPGCGKTFIIRKLAEELDYNFFEVKHSDLATPFIHGSVSNISKVFDMAKENAPAIVFFDEISGLVPDRQALQESSSHKEEEINQFLIELNDAADNKVLVVGATNYIDRIDPAILRPGRIDKKIYVSPPDYEARKALFQLGLSGRPYDKKIDFDKLAELTDGYSSADIIEGIIENAARLAANLDKMFIDQKLLEEEVKRIKPVAQEEKRKLGFTAGGK